MIHRSGQSYSIALQDDAKRDLDALYESNEDAAADIEVFLEEAKHNQYTLENLTRHGYVQYEDPAYNVKEWKAAKHKRLNLWRIRLMSGRRQRLSHCVCLPPRPISLLRTRYRLP